MGQAYAVLKMICLGEKDDRQAAWHPAHRQYLVACNASKTCWLHRSEMVGYIKKMGPTRGREKETERLREVTATPQLERDCRFNELKIDLQLVETGEVFSHGL